METQKNTSKLDGVVCDVCTCTYNDNKACYASSIRVGNDNAHTSRETECDTFKAKNA